MDQNCFFFIVGHQKLDYHEIFNRKLVLIIKKIMTTLNLNLWR